MNKQFIVITDNDLDGAMCAILSKLRYESEGTVTVKFAGKSSDRMISNMIRNKSYQNYDKIIIADVGITRQTASTINRLENAVERFIFVDHHEDMKFIASNAFKWATVSYKKNDTEIYSDCAASLLYEVYKPQLTMMYTENTIRGLKQMVNQVTQYDTWSWFATETLEPLYLNLLLQTFGLEDFVSKTMVIAKSEFRQSLISTNMQAAKAMHGVLKKQVEMYVEVVKTGTNNFVTKDGLLATSVYCNLFISEIGNYIAKECPDIDLVVLWNENKMAFRTAKTGLNLPELAKKHGGSGRGKSASIPIDSLMPLDAIRNVFEGDMEILAPVPVNDEIEESSEIEYIDSFEEDLSEGIDDIEEVESTSTQAPEIDQNKLAIVEEELAEKRSTIQEQLAMTEQLNAEPEPEIMTESEINQNLGLEEKKQPKPQGTKNATYKGDKKYKRVNKKPNGR